jgi:hypothetical protein
MDSFAFAFNETLQKAIDRLPTVCGPIGDVAVDVAAGEIPLPFVSSAVSALKAAAKAQRAREERSQEWLAVLFAARRGSARR